MSGVSSTSSSSWTSAPYSSYSSSGSSSSPVDQCLAAAKTIGDEHSNKHARRGTGGEPECRIQRR
jgi:hypothetical protein